MNERGRRALADARRGDVIVGSGVSLTPKLFGCPPRRVRLRRTPGWQVPSGVIIVARPTRWANPFRIGDPLVEDQAAAVARFEALLLCRRHGRELPSMPDYPSDEEIRRELGGHDLGCWCLDGSPCHALVLLRVSNEAR